MIRGIEPKTSPHCYSPFVIIANRFRRVKITDTTMITDWIDGKSRPWIRMSLKNADIVQREYSDEDFKLHYPEFSIKEYPKWASIKRNRRVSNAGS